MVTVVPQTWLFPTRRGSTLLMMRYLSCENGLTQERPFLPDARCMTGVFITFNAFPDFLKLTIVKMSLFRPLFTR